MIRIDLGEVESEAFWVEFPALASRPRPHRRSPCRLRPAPGVEGGDRADLRLPLAALHRPLRPQHAPTLPPLPTKLRPARRTRHRDRKRPPHDDRRRELHPVCLTCPPNRGRSRARLCRSLRRALDAQSASFDADVLGDSARMRATFAVLADDAEQAAASATAVSRAPSVLRSRPASTTATSSVDYFVVQQAVPSLSSR